MVGAGQLMICTAAYSGLRQGEVFALTTGQIDPAARVIDVDRKVIEVSGKLLTGAPKGPQRRKTIYPVRTPQAYPLAGKIAARIQAARAERAAGVNPLGLMSCAARIIDCAADLCLRQQPGRGDGWLAWCCSRSSTYWFAGYSAWLS